MHYVYLLESQLDPSKRYVGFTSQQPQARLDEHNSGKSIHTNKHKPWKFVVCIGFVDQEKAQEFETYLKQGSGHAFAKKHFW